MTQSEFRNLLSTSPSRETIMDAIGNLDNQFVAGYLTRDLELSGFSTGELLCSYLKQKIEKATRREESVQTGGYGQWVADCTNGGVWSVANAK